MGCVDPTPKSNKPIDELTTLLEGLADSKTLRKEAVGLTTPVAVPSADLTTLEHQVRFLFQHFFLGSPSLSRCFSSSASISGLFRKVGAMHRPTMVIAAGETRGRQNRDQEAGDGQGRGGVGEKEGKRE